MRLSTYLCFMLELQPRALVDPPAYDVKRYHEKQKDRNRPTMREWEKKREEENDYKNK